ncbi:sensor histidine kinase [Tenacibaculum jejuense]|uniref:histidine kinase n=1 Tax=Tenacibaculum jejuense TaxID=584609 RepID=A0A238UDK5_9FLAO|nr:HAMP domain-containing sensor histidine kinase [Tenacibaculum jejuense]SNR17283.1 Two-component system sensor histidine kinase [Tenacibaculum jejuense]
MLLKTLFIACLFTLIPSTLIFSQNKNDIYLDILKYSNNIKSESELNKAIVFFSEKKWDSTLIYTQKYLSKFKPIHHSKNLVHYIRGVSLFKKNAFTEAKNQLAKISPNFKFHNIKEFYLGYINISLYKYEEAITHFLPLSLKSNNELKYFKKESMYKNLSSCYSIIEQFDKAEYYFEKVNQSTKDTLKLIDNYTNRAHLYLKNKKLKFLYLKKAYKLSKQISYDSSRGLNTKYKKIDFLKRKRKASKNMAIIEENYGRYTSALYYRKEYEKYHDIINSQNKIYEVAKKEKELALAGKQKEIDLFTTKNKLLKTENKLKTVERNNLFFTSGILFILLLTSAYFYREKVKTNKVISSQKETLNELNITKDKLFSIVSHDLRSSVNALKTSNRVLLENLQSKNINVLEDLLQKNSGIVNGAYGLLDNLLNWALLQTDGGYFHIESHRLFFIVEHVAYNYKGLFREKKIHFENKTSKKATVTVDQESLKLILRNLLDNAIKFSRPKGSISLYTKESNNYWCLIVEDTGLGMSEHTRLELLQETTILNKKVHKNIIGTGLGLSLVKSMIQKNNGKFNIESTLEKGTKIIVSLPKNYD